jgi:toxin FitB
MFLADTNIVSELARHAPNDGVVAWAESIERVAFSVVTLEEIRYGLALRPNKRVEAWFDRFIADRVDVLDVTQAVAVRCGALRGKLAARGEVRSQADMLIAATAAVHRLTVVTRNVKDFAGCGVRVRDPFV